MSQTRLLTDIPKSFLKKWRRTSNSQRSQIWFRRFAGGRMNENEFFEDWSLSMQREIEEELGSQVQIRVSTKPLFIHKHKVNEGNFPCIIIAYHADNLGGDIILSDEHDYISWEKVQTYEPSPLFTEYMLDAVNLYLKEYAPLVH